MPPDLLKTNSGAEKFLAAHVNKKCVTYLKMTGILMYCCFMYCISPMEGLIRTGADYLTKGLKKPDIQHG